MNATIWAFIEPFTTIVIGIILPAIATWLAARIVSFLNVTDTSKQLEIEAQIRNALHSAATNAVAYARAKLGIDAPVSAIVNEAFEYVSSKNPDTLASLGVSDKDLTDIILSKIGAAK